MKKSRSGFTIIELLIVIVVIAILAAITVIAYNGIQKRARDSQRKSDMALLQKALELYYLDNGFYPPGSCSVGCKINGSWSSTSDGSWPNLESALVPRYLSKLPTDPQASSTTNPAIIGGYNYDYVSPGGWCTKPSGQIYMLTYRLENETQKFEVSGNCSGTQPTNYSSSEFTVTK